MSLILGSASTGAKYTPRNHLNTGNPVLDRICRGDAIPVSEAELVEELAELYDIGCRYFHYHARSFDTREQTTDNQTYARIGRMVRSHFPAIVVSFGASRNGEEVQRNISRYGEWERVSQAGLLLDEGGAHFVTIQAAVELQIICDLERKLGRDIDVDYVNSKAFIDDVTSYVPSINVEKMDLATNSTSRGGNYGSSSALVQLDIYSQAVKARNGLRLFHEVEWVQFARSYAMTRMAIERADIGLASNGLLNISLLFGFSPKLPFPNSFEEFKRVVAAAKSLELDPVTGERKRRVTVTVGAAVLPQHAEQHVRELDVGPSRGKAACALRRLAAWAAQPHSNVDVLRSGMEDTPYEVHLEKGILPANNVRLCQIIAEECQRNEAELVVDPRSVTARLCERSQIMDGKLHIERNFIQEGAHS